MANYFYRLPCEIIDAIHTINLKSTYSGVMKDIQQVNIMKFDLVMKFMTSFGGGGIMPGGKFDKINQIFWDISPYIKIHGTSLQRKWLNKRVNQYSWAITPLGSHSRRPSEMCEWCAEKISQCREPWVHGYNKNTIYVHYLVDPFG